MKDSDFFLELFEDDLLKPVENIVVQKSEILQNDNEPKPSTSIPAVVRAEFDICAALDQEKEKNEQKHKRFIEKQKGKLDFSKEKSLIHSGDTDSSDDEDNKYMDSYNYNEFGRDVKRMLASNDDNSPSGKIKNDNVDMETSAKKDKPTVKVKVDPPKSKQPSVKQMSLPDNKAPKTIDVYADPFFGIRIVTPLISSQGIQIRMSGKIAVTLAKLQAHIAKKVDTDFVTAGVIVRSVTKQSQNDNQYMIWEISDLKDDLLVVPVFIFGNSYKDLWKTQIGTVVAILNPTSGNKKGGNGNDSFSVSVKFSDQVMIWGHSKDFGTCKSLKKNGEKCTSFVNRSRCEFCVYHVKKEYSKFSSNRSEIQSPMGGRSMNFLRNKVLGKNEVFYGGQSYTAVKPLSEKAKEKAKKLTPKDQQRLSNLGVTVFENKHENKNNTISLPLAPRAAQVLRTLNMDSQILKSLSSPDNLIISKLNSPQNKPLNQSTINFKAENNAPKLTNPNLDKSKKVPSLTNPESDFSLNSPISKTNNKLDKSFNGSKDVKSKVPSLSNPEKEDMKSSQSENIVGNRTKLLFDEAISKMDSPKSKDKKKSDKPSLSNPEFNESPKNKNESKSKSSKSSKKELFSSNVNSNKLNQPSLSDPSSDLVKCNTQKVENNDNKKKDLQSKFKSLLSVASGQKRKTIVPEMENTNSKQIDSDFSKNSVDIGQNNSVKSSSRIKEKDDNIDSPKSKSKSLDKGNEESAVSSSSQKTPTAYKSELPSLYQSTGLYQSPAAKKMAKAKARALMFVKQNGPLNKVDPNAIKKSQETTSKKRDRTDSNDAGGGDDSGKVVFSELYIQLMKQTSQQQDLVEAEKLRMEEEYFEKMGLKEQLEEKMLNTFKIDCKAVKCLQCKYIWFSAADKCKAERHTLKIVDTVKRFFKCGNCSNRTVSLHVVPMFSCKNCSSSNWQRAPMMREKIVKNDNQLSIRGGEQQHINSQATNSNLNLLVPD